MFSDLTLRTKYNSLAPVDAPSQGPGGLGLVLHQTKNLLKCVYDFTVSGGLVASFLLLDDVGNPAILPAKSIITNVIMDFYTAFTSGGSATISLQAEAANDLKNALAVASATGLVAGIPVGTAATAVKTTVARQITMVVGTAALTAGKANFFIEYEISN